MSNKYTIGIVGVGNVGSTLAFSLASSNLCNKILLKDIREDFIKAMALDISQAILSLDLNCKIIPTNSTNRFKDCDIVVITAGVARKPNMSREDLLITNSNIMKSILDEVFQENKNAIYIIVSNPLDALVYFTLKYTNLPRNRVLGMAGTLDSARFKYYISQKLNFEYKKIDAIVIGSHSSFMLPLINHAKVDDKKIIDILSKEDIKDILENTKNGGAKIVDLIGTSAYFAPAQSIFNMCKAILNDNKEEFCASVMLLNEFGYNDTALGVPIILGKNGVEQIKKLELSYVEKQDLYKSSLVVQESINILKKETI